MSRAPLEAADSRQRTGDRLKAHCPDQDVNAGIWKREISAGAVREDETGCE
ncbi:MAG: hypothetical protein OXK76_10830 [Gammaproteobacteria bacterium]|nr:hypothetical protein [Gammaproteobacteria bacterium]